MAGGVPGDGCCTGGTDCTLVSSTQVHFILGCGQLFSMLNKVQIAFVHILLVFETNEIASCLFHAGLLTRCCFRLL